MKNSIEQQARKAYHQALCSGDRKQIQITKGVYYSLVQTRWNKENKI